MVLNEDSKRAVKRVLGSIGIEWMSHPMSIIDVAANVGDLSVSKQRQIEKQVVSELQQLKDHLTEQGFHVQSAMIARVLNGIRE